jgi:hypothetical protein
MTRSCRGTMVPTAAVAKVCIGTRASSLLSHGATSTGLHDPIVEQNVTRCGQCNRAYVGTTATGRSRSPRWPQSGGF